MSARIHHMTVNEHGARMLDRPIDEAELQVVFKKWGDCMAGVRLFGNELTELMKKIVKLAGEYQIPIEPSDEGVRKAYYRHYS